MTLVVRVFARGWSGVYRGGPTVDLVTLLQRPGPPPSAAGRPGAPRRWVLAVLVVAAVAAVSAPCASYVGALTYPGDASVTVRTVEWVRDHGGGGIVDLVENWWYARPPAAASLVPADLPRPATAVATGAPPAVAPVVPALPGE